MILRACSILAISIGGVCVQAGPPGLQRQNGVDGKIAPARQQDFFQSDAPSTPRLLPLAIREPLPPKFAPPVAGWMESFASGTMDPGFTVRIALAIMKDAPVVRPAEFSESREPPLAELP